MKVYTMVCSECGGVVTDEGETQTPTFKRQRDRLLETSRELLWSIEVMAPNILGASVKFEAGIKGLVKRSQAAIADCGAELTTTPPP